MTAVGEVGRRGEWEGTCFKEGGGVSYFKSEFGVPS